MNCGCILEVRGHWALVLREGSQRFAGMEKCPSDSENSSITSLKSGLLLEVLILGFRVLGFRVPQKGP